MTKENLNHQPETFLKVEETRQNFVQTGIVEKIEKIRDDHLLTFCRDHREISENHFYPALVDYNGNSIQITFDSLMTIAENGESHRLVYKLKKVIVTKVGNVFETTYQDDYKNSCDSIKTETLDHPQKVIDRIEDIVQSNRQ